MPLSCGIATGCALAHSAALVTPAPCMCAMHMMLPFLHLAISWLPRSEAPKTRLVAAKVTLLTNTSVGSFLRSNAVAQA